MAKTTLLFLSMIWTFTFCNEQDVPDPLLQSKWLFKESHGSLLGYVTADPDAPEILEFTSDGMVRKTKSGNLLQEYYYTTVESGGEVQLHYKYDIQADFNPFHKAAVDGSNLTLVPYLGENTSCADCPTEIYSRVITKD